MGQAIIWINAGLIHKCIYATVEGDELMLTLLIEPLVTNSEEIWTKAKWNYTNMLDIILQS